MPAASLLLQGLAKAGFEISGRVVGEIVPPLDNRTARDEVSGGSSADRRDPVHASHHLLGPGREPSLDLEQLLAALSDEATPVNRLEAELVRDDLKHVLTLDWVRKSATVEVVTGLGLGQHEAMSAAFRMFDVLIHREQPHGDVQGALQIGDAVRYISDLKREAETLVSATRKALETTAIHHHAQVFGTEASGHLTASKWWLSVSGLLFVVVVALAGWFLVDLPNSTPELVGRLTCLSLLVAGVGVAVRQFSVARHNWVVASHRRNALASYEAFALAVADETAKQAMLAHAIGLVFSAQDTGYSRGKGASDSTGIFAELIKQLGAGGR